MNEVEKRYIKNSRIISTEFENLVNKYNRNIE